MTVHPVNPYLAATEWPGGRQRLERDLDLLAAARRHLMAATRVIAALAPQATLDATRNVLLELSEAALDDLDRDTVGLRLAQAADALAADEAAEEAAHVTAERRAYLDRQL